MEPTFESYYNAVFTDEEISNHVKLMLKVSTIKTKQSLLGHIQKTMASIETPNLARYNWERMLAYARKTPLKELKR